MGLREFIHAKTAPASAALEEVKASGVLVLNEQQFQHFQECMTNPKEPTEALRAGIKLIQELRQKTR